MKIPLNDGWAFSPAFTDEQVSPAFDDSGFERVRLPHTAVETPFNCFDESVYQMVMTYRRHIVLDDVYPGQTVRLTFEGAAHAAEVYLDGVKVGEHFGGYTAFTVDLTGRVCPGKDHLIAIKLDSRESLNIPPFGHVIDYMTYGGLYREVFLDITRPVYIEDSYIRTDRVLDEKKRLRIDGRLGGAGSGSAGMPTGNGVVSATGDRNAEHSIRITLLDTDGTEIATPGTISFLGKTFSAEFEISGVELWSLDHPRLYVLRAELENGEFRETRFAFREIAVRSDGLFLNGERMKLRGLNRHQSYPFVGYAMPASVQRLDADILKYELGLNAVRTSHYPQSRHFIDRCDEIGLLVFTEIPGWQHIGNEVWKEHAIRHVEEMILQYRNHPSIFLWGVRINESPDDHDFYSRTNALARRLDPDRPTGGVRYIKRSELLEDVYTYNDFSHTGDNAGIEKKNRITTRRDAPYLVSEYNGHMFPTKVFDDETHRLNHALRHARVLNDLYSEPDVLGGFGWCMFDYNTHKDFGSGDRICYHGVLDMFRNPKLAAAVYASQRDNAPVLEISSSMDVGEYPGSVRGEIVAFTNADEVRLYKNGRFIKSFSRKKSRWDSLPRAPIVIDDFLGDQLDDEPDLPRLARRVLKKLLLLIARYGPAHLPARALALGGVLMFRYGMSRAEITGYYTRYIGDWGQKSTAYRFDAVTRGQVVASCEKRAMRSVHLDLRVDHTMLCESATYDVATVRIRALSDAGNLLPYCMEPVILETDGPIELIGPSTLTLRGGMTGTYVRSCGTAGSGTLRVILPGRETREIHFDISIGEAPS